MEEVTDDFKTFLDEKFPQGEDNGADYSNPLDAASQIKAAKESAAKRNIGVPETIRRLKSGRKFD